jgi:uncharacterized protein (TIGR03545 family)
MANVTTPTPGVKPVKKKKAKGPIRYEAIVPITLVVLLIFAYFKFFFDYHLRKGIEYGATYANGAEVNVGFLNTSFWNASLRMGNIQVTNKEAPKQNIIQIGGVSFKTDWDGLLRGKVIISDAAIDDIMVNTPRKHAGRVLPVKKSSGNAMETLKGQALQETQKVLDGNIFGDVAAVAGGENYKDKLKDMQGELKSAQFIAKMETELKTKEVLWKERIAKLPKKEEFKAIEARVKAIKVDGKDPASAVRAIAEIDSLYKEVDSKVKAVKESKEALNSDIAEYKNIYGDIQKFVDEDIKDLEGKLGIPSLDPKDLAMRVFGRQFGSQIQRAEKYMRIAREYMPPPKKPGEKEEITPREREVGKSYKFPITKYYPQFWLKRAHINSKATEGGFSGNIAGDILNVTNEPHTLGLPAEAKLSGDFPHSNISGVVLHAIIDHTTDVPKESGVIRVGAFPLEDMMLSKSHDVTFGFKKAIGSSELKAELQEEKLSINFDATFDKIDYIVESEKAKVKEILTGIAGGLGALTLNGHADGTWKNMSLGLNSNLGARLQAALKAEFDKQISGLKEQLRAKVNEKVAGQKEKLMAQVKGFEEKYGVSLKSQDEAINSLKAKLDEEKNKATKKQGQKLEDAAKKLFKGIKF